MKILMISGFPMEGILLAGFLKNREDIEFLGLFAPSEDSLKLLAMQMPDLVLFDIDLNQNECFQMMQSILIQSPELSFVAVSTYDDFSLVQTSLRCGCRDFLLKPLKQEDIDYVIRRFFPSHRMVGISNYQDVVKKEKENKLDPGEEGSDKADYYCFRQIMKAKQMIDERVQEKILLEEIAKEIYMSPFYFSRMFKEITGINFTEYVLNKKVDKAMEYLSNTVFSVEEIGLLVGYEEANSFRRMFKKKVGLSPREYRKQQNKR